MALVHDMAECIVGDITPHDDISDAEKYQKEQVCQLWHISLILYKYCLLFGCHKHTDSPMF